MKTRILNFITMLSLAAAILIAVFWVRSYWRYDEPCWVRRGREGLRGTHFSISVASECGYVYATSQWYAQNYINVPADWPADHVTENRFGWDVRPAYAGRYDHLPMFLGFYSGKIVQPQLVSRGVLIPHWFLFALLILLPAHRLYRQCRKTPLPGLCPKCGYDLRATPDRCPECGQATMASGT